MISIKRYQKIIARLALCLVFSINLLSEPEKVLLKTIDAKNILTGPNGELKLEGNVYIKTNLLEFWSDRATYNKENQSFKLAGNVKVLSKNLELSSKTLAANLSEQTFMGRQGWLESNNALLAFKAFEHRGLFATDV